MPYRVRSLKSPPVSPSVLEQVRRAVGWYTDTQYRQNATPFYCDPLRTGGFAVPEAGLAAGTEAALFRLFITLAMYQALRDVVIMRQQRSLPGAAIKLVADSRTVKRAIAEHPCGALRSADAFRAGCDVAKSEGTVDCGRLLGAPCHVKDATVLFNRMGDMGKLPTDAWLQLWADGGVRRLLREVCRTNASPVRRAELLVEHFAGVHRVGRKLATLFVSALSTPALAPGLAPWFPEVDGNELVVVDTNVARASDALRPALSPKTYEARAVWVRAVSSRIDLRALRPELPAYSPRFVQESLYAFGSHSNRVASHDPCAGRTTRCERCASRLCPF